MKLNNVNRTCNALTAFVAMGFCAACGGATIENRSETDAGRGVDDAAAVAIMDGTIEADAPNSVLTPLPECIDAGNILFIASRSATQPSIVVQGTWQTQALPTEVHITVYTGSPPSLEESHLDVSSEHLHRPLVPGLYEGAQRQHFEAEGHPGFDLSTPGPGCDSVDATFVIENLETDPAGILLSFAADWDMSCDGSPRRRGCVRYQR